MGSWDHVFMGLLVHGFMVCFCVPIWTAFAIVGPLLRLPGHGLLCVSVSPSLKRNENPISLKILLGKNTPQGVTSTGSMT
jgi:hypothetical protein